VMSMNHDEQQTEKNLKVPSVGRESFVLPSPPSLL
jgi:hypothetical protein